MDAFWLYLHILLLVFWVGTDVGVFIAAKWSERATLSMETRQAVLQLGMVLDRLPRSALTLIIPSGCQLAVASGWLDIPAQYLLGMWAFAAIWRAITGRRRRNLRGGTGPADGCSRASSVAVQGSMPPSPSFQIVVRAFVSASRIARPQRRASRIATAASLR